MLKCYQHTIAPSPPSVPTHQASNPFYRDPGSPGSLRGLLTSHQATAGASPACPGCTGLDPRTQAWILPVSIPRPLPLTLCSLGTESLKLGGAQAKVWLRASHFSCHLQHGNQHKSTHPEVTLVLLTFKFCPCDPKQVRFSLALSFLICKMRIIVVPASLGCHESKQVIPI